MSDNDSAIRKTVTLPESLWRRVSDHRFGSKFNTETAAVQHLIETGLAAVANANVFSALVNVSFKTPPCLPTAESVDGSVHILEDRDGTQSLWTWSKGQWVYTAPPPSRFSTEQNPQIMGKLGWRWKEQCVHAG